jgi:hypothetical protein
MQIHEITNKNIKEGVMDTIRSAASNVANAAKVSPALNTAGSWLKKKGVDQMNRMATAGKAIGGIAAQGVNNAIGTNLGGVAAGAMVNPVQRQQQALAINLGLAKQQANQLASHHQQAIKQLAKQSGNQDGSLNPPELEQLTKMVNQIVTGQLLKVGNLDSLVSQVDPADKQRMAQLVSTIGSTMAALENPVASMSKQNLDNWIAITQAAAEVKNLLTFSPGKVKNTNGVYYDELAGEYKVRGQSYDKNNPAHRVAMSAYQASQPK